MSIPPIALLLAHLHGPDPAGITQQHLVSQTRQQSSFHNVLPEASIPTTTS
jgi:hypothetical protein